MVNAGLRINSSPLASFNTVTNSWDNILVTVVYPVDEEQQNSTINPIKLNDVVVDTLAKVWEVTDLYYLGFNNFKVSLKLLNLSPSQDIIPNIGDTRACVCTPINNKISPYWNASFIDSCIFNIANSYNIKYIDSMKPTIIESQELITSIQTDGLYKNKVFIQNRVPEFITLSNVLNRKTAQYQYDNITYDFQIEQINHPDYSYSIDFGDFITEILTDTNNTYVSIDYIKVM